MNMLLKFSSMLFLMTLVGCNMSGCGLFNTEPFADTTKDQQGNQVLADTPRMWENWTERVDRRVSREVAGSRPPGGKASWNEFWVSLIEENKDGGRENAQKYISYIIEKRQEAGLPPLEGYPE